MSPNRADSSLTLYRSAAGQGVPVVQRAAVANVRSSPSVGLVLDDPGWVFVDELLAG